MNYYANLLLSNRGTHVNKGPGAVAVDADIGKVVIAKAPNVGSFKTNSSINAND